MLFPSKLSCCNINIVADAGMQSSKITNHTILDEIWAIGLAGMKKGEDIILASE